MATVLTASKDPAYCVSDQRHPAVRHRYSSRPLLCFPHSSRRHSAGLQTGYLNDPARAPDHTSTVRRNRIGTSTTPLRRPLLRGAGVAVGAALGHESHRSARLRLTYVSFSVTTGAINNFVDQTGPS